MILNLSMKPLFGDVELKLLKGTYSGNNTALRLVDTEDGTSFATITVNIPELSHLLEDDEFFVKTWSENGPIIEALRKLDLFTEVAEKKFEYGFRDVMVEVWKFTDPNTLNQLHFQ